LALLFEQSLVLLALSVIANDLSAGRIHQAAMNDLVIGMTQLLQ
jgi:hypothetical protein